MVLTQQMRQVAGDLGYLANEATLSEEAVDSFFISVSSAASLLIENVVELVEEQEIDRVLYELEGKRWHC